MVDLCYQTLALAEIDRTKYAAQIRANAERILSLQRAERPVVDAVRPEGARSRIPDRARPVGAGGGRNPGRPAAGAEGDRVPARIASRRSAAGWTRCSHSKISRRRSARLSSPCWRSRRTIPLAGRAKGWDSPAPQSLSAAPDRLLTELDGLWDRPSDAVLRQMEEAAQSNEVLVRQAAVEALGRLALPDDRAAAGQALGGSEQTGAAHRRVGFAPDLRRAPRYRRPRTRWRRSPRQALACAGALRASSPIISPPWRDATSWSPRSSASLPTPRPPSGCRPSADCGKSWFWNPGVPLRGRIEDTLLAGLAAAAASLDRSQSSRRGV